MTSIGNNQSAPNIHEFEISIFGKGIGECIVVHVGNGEWIIVDSFQEPYTKIPIAIQYLQSIGVDLPRQVKAIVATHWHDDHVQGLSQIIKECPNTMFICSGATKLPEFVRFICADADLETKRPGVREFYKIFDLVRERGSEVSLAGENKIHLNTSQYTIRSLSPSDYAILAAQKEIVSLLPKNLQTRKGITDFPINYTSVVLLIQSGKRTILLGGDLEITDDSRLGWTRIISSPGRSDQKCEAFKVPHHGSETAHHDGIWSILLHPNPYTALTSYIRGRVSIPTPRDIRRIHNSTKRAWITTNPESRRRVTRREQSVEKTIREITKTIFSISDCGQIRMRAPINSDSEWAVDLFGTATELVNCL